VMDDTELDAAQEALRRREGIHEDNSNYIGVWSQGEPAPTLILDLPQWATSHGVHSIIWTALPSKFNGENEHTPTCAQVVKYLSGLTGAARDTAERYIRLAPRQIDTRYRRQIEAILHWTPLSSHVG
jgi:hypothetical protein